MTKEQKTQIVKISKSFAKGIGEINGSCWLVVDPLSAYLNAFDFQNEIKQIPQTSEHPQVLIMIFKDGSTLVPAGADLKPINDKAKNWMWL